MYDPIKDGVEKAVRLVSYSEVKPPSSLSATVHSFWELKTERPLAEDFQLHAIPDACVNLLFNQVDPEIAGVTALHTTFEVLNLGKSFHYVGVQFLPGVWQGKKEEIKDSFVGMPYEGNLPLVEAGIKMADLDFPAKQTVMSDLVARLVEQGLVVPNLVTKKILSNLDSIKTVGNMASLAGLSSRQLQRVIREATDLSPHDFLKILRLQQSFKQHYLMTYTDQSHFIHSFRKITGHTPAQYAKKFDV